MFFQQPNLKISGKDVLRLLDELDSIERVHPEIEDSVQWVKQIRKE